MNQINIKGNKSGVGVNIKGDAKLDDIQKLADDCNNGQCGCENDTLNKINKVSVSGVNSDVNIKITGKIKQDEVEACMGGGCCGL